jgi:hypothetical protein
MNKGTYTYALLQYRHSQILGEVLNVGLVVYFPDFQRLDFIAPERLIRLKFAYPDVSEKTIKSYFKYFTSRTKELNLQSEVFGNYNLESSLENFLAEEFLAPDSSCLQFGNYKTAVLYTSDLEHITNQLYNLYFSVFHLHDNSSKKVDETLLLKKYKHFLAELLPESKSLKDSSRFYDGYSIKPNENSLVKFDIAWKGNKDTHLVKPISFDLVKPESIQRKAYQYFGQFEDLQDYAENNDYLFDVILAKPKNKVLFKAYDNAIRLLEKPKRVQLIEQIDLQGYSEKTIEAALF